MLRTGFIGAGRRATRAHYPTIHQIDDIALEAVTELDEGRMLSVADKYQIPKTFVDYGKMLNEVDLDATGVTSPWNFDIQDEVCCRIHSTWNTKVQWSTCSALATQIAAGEL